MTRTNTTAVPDYALRQLVAWCCKEAGLPVRQIRHAAFRYGLGGGLCKSRSRYIGMRIRRSAALERFTKQELERLDPARIIRQYTSDFRKASSLASESMREKFETLQREKPWLVELEREARDMLAGVVLVTAHEIGHLFDAWKHGRTRGEPPAKRIEERLLKRFRAKTEELLDVWLAEPAPRATATKPKRSLQEVRHDKAAKKLKAWGRKLKLAQTKVKQYRERCRYYERVAAKRSDVDMLATSE